MSSNTDSANTDTITAAPAAKRDRDELYDAGSDDDFTPSSPKDNNKKARKGSKSDDLDATAQVYSAELRPAPYFYYRDHSTEVDEDPLTPVTAAGHVPCFPAKMHAILASPDLNDIVAWDDHGRSFRILKPKRFECYILPRFFEHSKFSSFIRQANGWGFRRFLSGPNRNSYYQEYFLRSMPWLCKKMRRPKVGEKKSVSPEHEPDLRLISLEFPIPNAPMTREIQIVLETIKTGPRARMPVHWAAEKLPPNAQQRGANRDDSRVSGRPDLARANSFGLGMGAMGAGMNFNALQMQALMGNPANLMGNPMANPGNLMSNPANLMGNPPNPMAFPAPMAQPPSRRPSDAGSDVQMSDYLRSLQDNQSTVVRAASGDLFLAGFQTATRYHNDSVCNMINNGVHGPPVPLAPGSMGGVPQQAAAAGVPPAAMGGSNANAAYMQLLQMQMAAQGMGAQAQWQGSFGTGVAAGANPPRQVSHNGAQNLSLEQLQAYQAGMWHPNASQQSNGR